MTAIRLSEVLLSRGSKQVEVILMTRYKDKRWKHKRENVLKRDLYLCRQCKRYGKDTQATMVHHILSVDNSPELYLDSLNLLSLCNSCHNEMHDRVTDDLTDVGR